MQPDRSISILSDPRTACRLRQQSRVHFSTDSHFRFRSVSDRSGILVIIEPNWLFFSTILFFILNNLLNVGYSQLSDRLHYCPIDVSAGILKATALALLDRYPSLKLCGLAGTYEQALAQLPPPELENRMLIFLGSTLGNLNDKERNRFLTQIKQALQPGEFFLLGVDLQKPISTIPPSCGIDNKRHIELYAITVLQF
jgi:hypothetical protein